MLKRLKTRIIYGFEPFERVFLKTDLIFNEAQIHFPGEHPFDGGIDLILGEGFVFHCLDHRGDLDGIAGAQDHVVAGGHSLHGCGIGAVGLGDGLHVQVVGEDNAVNAHVR